MYLKISAGFIASFMAMMMLSCSGKHSEQQTPMASRMSDSVKVAWQQPQEAVLRIHLESARPTDLLTEVTVKGAGIAQDVSVMSLSKLMTHPFERDFSIEPCEEQTDVMVTATVGEETVQTRTMVPHLLKGTRTQLNLFLERGHMRIVSSWITETTEGASAYRCSEDSIGKGFFLHGDGIVTREKGEDAVAIVIETDGRHGKAVALQDVAGMWLYSGSGATSGAYYETLDGERSEGTIYNSKVEADSTQLIRYYPELRMPEGAALAREEGYDFCDSLRSRFPVQPEDMLSLMEAHRGAYIPSVSELTNLYFLCRGYDRYGYVSHGLGELSGVYLSSTESGEDTCYSVDFTRGTVTGSTSKRYSPLKVRLFYIF